MVTAGALRWVNRDMHGCDPIATATDLVASRSIDARFAPVAKELG